MGRKAKTDRNNNIITDSRGQRVIYYTDERNDDFSVAQINAIRIDDGYNYEQDKGFGRVVRFVLYRVVATPLAFLYTRLVPGHRTVGRALLKPFRKTGYFLYGNHTSNYGDPLMPNMFAYPKDVYFVVHAANVSMPFLGRINRRIGAIPLPDTVGAAKNFTRCIEKRINQGNAVVIYPEAHIWPYYTGIRDFPADSFGYPIRLDAPVFCFTNTYQRRRFRKTPRIVTYLDGPFYPDNTLPKAERIRDLRDRVYAAMCARAVNSDTEYIKYIKRESANNKEV
ncbi:MAG: 1-acyl-sn-glycerol-3-phosphate acyltransferase [Clostridia bacterium]|nr:1-acyl-sn-glycerol-3-phosphate acyltransferase [Clostridia bacterium]